MKLTEHFDTFLSDVVNLNQARIDTLKERVDAIITTLEGFEVYSDILIETCPQGSWAHRTIIKPAGNAGFDADIVVFMKPHEEWSPAEYIENLYVQFKGHGTYASKVSRKTRCVTIQYANEFSIDIVPCVRKSGFWETTEWVLNRSENTEEQTNPNGFNDWFKKQNGYVGKNYLIKVIRLLKYLRDIKMTFSAKSVLLTTLVGERVSIWDAGLGLDNDFTDVPTTLQIIIKRLDKYLQDNPDIPEVSNPSLSAESFTRHWDQDKYSNFRDCMHRYAEWIEDAYVEEDRDESILKWRRVFGEDFAKSVSLEKSANALVIVQSEDLSHVEPPKWPILSAGKIVVIATLYAEKEGDFKGTYRSDGPALKPGIWLHFSAQHSFTDSILIKWQVVNTGLTARQAKDLRGNISQTGPEIWECTKYKGCHWVECFAVDTKRGISLGRSGRFYVNVAC
jgi:Second Messenger Oligonucleotide or Dinucleotide Synthetase domain/Adenylyl/Guanylyl and SMODS C-terminal sensor domain